MTGNASTHTCSYFCDKPECIKAQRDELRDRLQRLDAQTVPVEPERLRIPFNDTEIWKSRNDWIIYAKELQSALQRAQEERDTLKSYWLAIDNRMVVLHLGTADSFDADTCMNKILEWETTIALDPQVSRPAQELKDTYLKRAEQAEKDRDACYASLDAARHRLHEITAFVSGDTNKEWESAHSLQVRRAEQAESERRDLKHALAMANRSADDYMIQKREAESLNKRLVELLCEPSDGMIAAGYPPDDERAQSWGVTEVFKAMSAELLKEVGE